MSIPTDDPEFLLWHFQQNAAYCKGYNTGLTIHAYLWEEYAETLAKVLGKEYKPTPPCEREDNYGILLNRGQAKEESSFTEGITAILGEISQETIDILSHNTPYRGPIRFVPELHTAGSTKSKSADGTNWFRKALAVCLRRSPWRRRG